MQRILLYGPPVAGKTTMLQAFTKTRALVLRQFNPLAGVSREVVEQGLPVPGSGAEVVDRGQFVHDPVANIGIATIWGPFWNLNSWPTLFARATAVVIVLDPQISRAAADRECVATLEALSKPPQLGCVVWTKQDLVAEGVETVPTSMLHGTMVEQWPVFTTRFDKPSSLVAPIEWLLRQLPTATPP